MVDNLAVKPSKEVFWPNDAKLVISIPMQFEAGAQNHDAEGPFPPIDPGLVDMITPTWYEYRTNEGITQLLDLWDHHNVKVTHIWSGKPSSAVPILPEKWFHAETKQLPMGTLGLHS